MNVRDQAEESVDLRAPGVPAATIHDATAPPRLVSVTSQTRPAS